MRKIILGLALVIAGFLVWQIFLPRSAPLADFDALTTLIEGNELSTPASESLAWFHGQQAVPPSLAELKSDEQVLGITDNKNKHIEIDLTRQKVYAYEGEQKVYDFSISSGKWAPTPNGEFKIWAKVRSQKMSGGNPRLGTYYYLPNVPHVMFFANDEVPKSRGFSLHGTYWHDNFGHPMSHGCVNMKTSEAKILYDWAMPQVTNTKAWSTLASADNPGTTVVIYGEAPKE